MLTPTKLQNELIDELLIYQHGYLWAAPGTGKTLMSLEACRRGGYTRIVVICPKIALTMWGQNLESQLGIVPLVVRTGATPMQDVEAIVITYALAASPKWRAQLEQFLANAESALILDEAHYCKSVEAKRSKAILQPPPTNRKGTPGGIATYAANVFHLTGTPITRYPDDLYMQLAYCRSEVLRAHGIRSYSNFVDRFCITKTMDVSRFRRVKQVIGAKNTEQLQQLLEQCGIVRCELSDVAADLPPVVERPISVDVTTPKKLKIEKGRVVQELQNKDSEYAKEYHRMGDEKAEKVIDYLKQMLSESRVPLLVGYWHKSVGDILQEALLGMDVGFARIDGSTSSTKRDKAQDDFNNKRIQIILGQMGALNVSYNLQEACSDVLIVEQLPSPGMYEQFIARVHRKGQKNHVQVDLVVCEHDLDKALIQIRDNKQAIVDKLL